MSDSLTGSQVAGYRIERLLGRGGMASVYFAWDTKNNRAVALKVMDERYRDTPSYVDRFVHEAQTIASWDHPNIIKVFDAGEENGIYYYAMEFFRGLDLAQLLRQYLDAGQLLPYNEVVRIGWAVSSALDFAHARGIIHRDVKPSNILISVDGRVVLSDFGLVMDVNRGTMGETFGSPHYIAPEQARTSAGAVPQSDIYSLGVILYEMLTGALPFHDESPTALALKHLTEEPPRPRALNPRLSPAVEAVLLRALRKRPEERYQTGREMMSALERALGSELQTDAATQPQPVSQATEFLRTQRANPAPNPAVQRAYAAGAGAIPGPAAGFGGGQNSQPNPPPRGYSGGGAQATSVRPAAGPAPVFGSEYSTTPPGGYYPPPGAPGSRGFRMRWGCLAGLLVAALLAVFAGAALSAFRPNFSLPGLFGAPAVGEVTSAAPPTATTRPTRTPTNAPRPTRTPFPTKTPAPTNTPLPPTATDTPAPTETSTQAVVVITSSPVYNLLIARQKNDGFVMVNTGSQPIPLGPLQLWSDQLELPGSEWQWDTLKPGECVAAWTKGVKTKMPTGVKCTFRGKLALRSGDGRFWTGPVNIHYNDQPVATCSPQISRCAFDIQSQ